MVEAITLQEALGFSAIALLLALLIMRRAPALRRSVVVKLVIMAFGLGGLALLSRFAIEGQSHIDLTSLAIEIADTPCSPIQYASPRSMTLALLRDRGKDV